MYVENLEMDNSLKWVLFIKVNGQITSDTLCIFIENFTYYFIPKCGRKYSHTNSYNSAMTIIVQDDHLTAGAWATCGKNKLKRQKLPEITANTQDVNKFYSFYV